MRTSQTKTSPIFPIPPLFIRGSWIQIQTAQVSPIFHHFFGSMSWMDSTCESKTPWKINDMEPKNHLFCLRNVIWTKTFMAFASKSSFSGNFETNARVLPQFDSTFVKQLHFSTLATPWNICWRFHEGIPWIGWKKSTVQGEAWKGCNNTWATKKKLITFHYPGWFIGIL